MPGNCCKKNEIKIIKIKDNYTSSSTTQTFPKELVLFATLFVQHNFSILNNQSERLFVSNHAPPDDPVSRTILFGTFLI